MRESYTFYRSFIEGLRDVDDATFRRLIESISRYALDDIEPELSGLEYGIYASWKANVDASNKRRENGKLGGRPSKEEPMVTEEKPMVIDSKPMVTDEKPNKKENKKENIKENKKEKRKFIPPTLEEVETYVRERNSPVNPKDFFDYFDTGHWIDSKGEPVKNWKQKLITWESHEKDKRNKASPKKFDAETYLLKEMGVINDTTGSSENVLYGPGSLPENV